DEPVVGEYVVQAQVLREDDLGPRQVADRAGHDIVGGGQHEQDSAVDTQIAQHLDHGPGPGRHDLETGHDADLALARLHAERRAQGEVSRSEEHTSELQSLTNLVCRLLLEKKKKNTNVLPEV